MPKFEKSTGYQLRQGNSPNKFIGRLFRGIFGGGKSKPKEIAGLNSGSRYGTNTTNRTAGRTFSQIGTAGILGGIGGPWNREDTISKLYSDIPSFDRIKNTGSLGGMQIAGRAMTPGNTLKTLPNRFASGRRRRRVRGIGSILGGGLLS